MCKICNHLPDINFNNDKQALGHMDADSLPPCAPTAAVNWKTNINFSIYFSFSEAPSQHLNFNRILLCFLLCATKSNNKTYKFPGLVSKVVPLNPYERLIQSGLIQLLSLFCLRNPLVVCIRMD